MYREDNWMTSVISMNINANNTPTHFQDISCQTNKQKCNFQPNLMHIDSALQGQYAQSYGYCKLTAFDKRTWILKSFNHHYFKTNKLTVLKTSMNIYTYDIQQLQILKQINEG